VLIWLKLDICDAGWDDAEDPVIVEGRAAAGGLLPGKACVVCVSLQCHCQSVHADCDRKVALLACNVIARAFMLIVTGRLHTQRQRSVHDHMQMTAVKRAVLPCTLQDQLHGQQEALPAGRG
jgi:hypothetical protein